MNIPTTTIDAVNGFLLIVDIVYGVYLDSTRGFVLGLQELRRAQQRNISDAKNTQPDFANEPYLDTLLFFYGKGPPGEPSSSVVHTATQGQVKKRNLPGGLNYKFIGNMSLVAIYQYWEDRYRAEIAKTLGVQPSQLRIPIMGDIRILRRSIIHHDSMALSEVTKCEVLKWFSLDDAIFISQGKMDTLIELIHQGIKDFLDKIASTPA